MNSVMTRSFADFMGFNWPKDVAYIENGRRVTYEQIKQDRIERQRKHLSSVLELRGEERRAAYVWTFFVPGVIYGGWHLYIVTLDSSDVWIKPRHGLDEFSSIALQIMRLYPCGLLPIPENFYAWKKAFAESYPRAGKKQQGLRFGWVTKERGEYGRIEEFTPAQACI